MPLFIWLTGSWSDAGHNKRSCTLFKYQECSFSIYYYNVMLPDEMRRMKCSRLHVVWSCQPSDWKLRPWNAPAQTLRGLPIFDAAGTLWTMRLFSATKAVGPTNNKNYLVMLVSCHVICPSRCLRGNPGQNFAWHLTGSDRHKTETPMLRQN